LKTKLMEAKVEYYRGQLRKHTQDERKPRKKYSGEYPLLFFVMLNMHNHSGYIAS